MPKRTIPNLESLSEDNKHLYETLNSERDLPLILVSSSYLDVSLGAMLKEKLISSSTSDKILDVRGGAIGSFSARADMCYSLGMVPKTLYKDLIKILEIRNIVAHHHLELDFTNEEIKKLCCELSYVESIRNQEKKPPKADEWMVGARNQFVITVVFINQRLLAEGLQIKKVTPYNKRLWCQPPVKTDQ